MIRLNRDRAEALKLIHNMRAEWNALNDEEVAKGGPDMRAGAVFIPRAGTYKRGAAKLWVPDA